MKTFFVAIIFFIATGVSGNVAFPKACISEIYIDATDYWSVEIGFLFEDYIDSIRIETTTGSSLIWGYSLMYCYDVNYESIAIIRNYNLYNPLTIHRECDYVKLITYFQWDIQTDFVSFGTYPGSYIDSFPLGTSISYIELSNPDGGTSSSFSLDKSPTIGECQQDTTGAMSNYSGCAYTPEGPPFSGGFIDLTIDNLQASVQLDGTFSARVFARRYFFNEIFHYPPLLYYPVDSFSFFLKPDSAYYHDIYTHYYVSVTENNYKNENSVVVFPNPIKTSTTFYISRNDFNKSNNLVLLIIIDGKGEKCFEYHLKGDESKVLWQPGSHFPGGMYSYYLLENGNKVRSGKLIKL